MEGIPGGKFSQMWGPEDSWPPFCPELYLGFPHTNPYNDSQSPTSVASAPYSPLPDTLQKFALTAHFLSYQHFLEQL